MGCRAAEAVEEGPAEVLISEPGAAVTVMQPEDPGAAVAQVLRRGLVVRAVLGQAALLESFSISIQRRVLCRIFCPIRSSWVQAETEARAETEAQEGKAVRARPVGRCPGHWPESWGREAWVGTAVPVVTVAAAVAEPEDPPTASYVWAQQPGLVTAVRTHSIRPMPLSATAAQAGFRSATQVRPARLEWSPKYTRFPDRLNLYGFRPWRLTRRDSSVSRLDAGLF
jgi:hypothetical protein